MVDRSRIVALGFVACSIMGPAFAKDLTFDDRVRAQRAIEQVYWGRRVWPKENAAPKPSLAEVMPDAAIRAKVERYLKESSALDALWQRPVTHDQLQAELDRLVRETHDGAMLSRSSRRSETIRT